MKSLTYSGDGESRDVLWDTEVKGFGVRVTPAGGKSYVLSYRIGGRARMMSLGAVSLRKVKDARTRAARLLLDLREHDLDPMASRDSLRESVTVREAFDSYLESVTNANSRRSLRSIFKEHVLPECGDRRPAQIRPEDVVRLHDRATLRGRVVANRAVQRLGDFLTWLHKRSPRIFPSDWRNPCRGVDLHEERPRHHVLTAERLRALDVALDADRNIYARSFLRLLILTGLRIGEARSLTWGAVDLVGGTALLRRTKSGADVRLRLSDDARALLEGLPRVADNPHVFPGLRGQPMHPPRASFRAAIKRAGLPAETTLHDLRRSVGTNLAMMGFSANQVALALHNTTDVAAKHYVHLAGELQAQLHERHAESLRPKPKAEQK